MKISQDYDYFSESSKLYTLLTERCGGNCKTLDKFLRNKMNLQGAEKIIFEVILQISFTLIYFQEIGVQHNDLHSGNIFVIEREEPVNIRLQFTKNIGVFYSSKYQIQIYDYDFSSIVKKSFTVANERWKNMSDFDKVFFCISNDDNFGVRDTWQVLWWINKELKDTKNKELYNLFVEFAKLFSTPKSTEAEEFFKTTAYRDEEFLQSTWQDGTYVEFVFDLDSKISTMDNNMVINKVKEFLSKDYTAGELYFVADGLEEITKTPLTIDPSAKIKQLRSIILDKAQNDSNWLDLTLGDTLQKKNNTTYDGCPCKSYALYKQNGIIIYNNYTEIYRTFRSSKFSFENINKKERLNPIFSLLDETINTANVIEGMLPSIAGENCKLFTKSNEVCKIFEGNF